MVLQELLASDLDTVFFDAGELASEHEIDGERLTVILEEKKFVSAEQKYQRNVHINPKESAINQRTLLLCIREADLQRKVSAGSMITVDGKKMFVSEVRHLDGEYILSIERYKV